MNNAITTALARKRNSLGTKEKGFTLIELLVVVLIIGVLAAVAIPLFINQQEGAKDSAVSAQLTQAKTAVSAEVTKGGTVTAAIAKLTANTLDSYSPSTDVLVAGTPSGNTFSITGFWGTTGSATASNHGYTITDKTAAVKMMPAP